MAGRDRFQAAAEPTVLLEAPRRIGGDDPGDVGDAVEHHLRLLQGTAAERAVGIELDLDRTGRFLVDRLGPRLHHREEGLLLVGREDGELELGLGGGVSRRDDAERAERETQGFHETSSGCKIIIF